MYSIVQFAYSTEAQVVYKVLTWLSRTVIFFSFTFYFPEFCLPVLQSVLSVSVSVCLFTSLADSKILINLSHLFIYFFFYCTHIFHVFAFFVNHNPLLSVSFNRPTNRPLAGTRGQFDGWRIFLFIHLPFIFLLLVIVFKTSTNGVWCRIIHFG